MDFNFLSSYNINSFPEVSPLVGNNYHLIDPFCQEEDDEDSFFDKYSPISRKAEKENEDLAIIPEKEKENSEEKDKENPEESLEISPKISGIIQSNLLDESDIKLDLDLEDPIKLNIKKTSSTTEKTKNGKIEIKERKEIFGLKTQTQKKTEILPRIDYAIKNFKVTAVKFIKELGNKLIKECKFKGELKNAKLFAPSNKYFTGISNEKENKIFLDFTVAEIFFYPNLEFGKDIRLQQNNKKTIDKMKEVINSEKDIPKAYEELKNFFDMTFADAIILFYKSSEFEKYKEDEKTKFLDSQFVKVKGFSLLESNAFISLMSHSQ